LDTRTKHIVAKDRLIVAEQQIIDVERRKSASNLQLLAFEQKQLAKRLLSLHSVDQSSKVRHRSISEANLHHNETLGITQSKFYASLSYNNQNLLSLPKVDDIPQRLSPSSDEDLSESGDEDNSKSIQNKKSFQPPILSVIPPEDDKLFLVQ